MLTNGDLMSGMGQFFKDLFQDVANGLIFFGGPLDIVIAAFDVLITTFVVYYILRLLRDSRAWQLLKGLILIIAFALAGSLAGLTTVGFLLNNTISVLAIAFVIIFQPELRRALETVGRSTFNVLSNAASGEDEKSGALHNMIESIVRACDRMSENRTGALIIIERQTRLSELLEQENVVPLDASISATFLMQVFYKGSPLHDGALLIRDGRVAGARIHVPLSDNYNLRKDYGTRHRAAVGASEMGDTIAVCVSEERGTISLAMDGRLFVLDNADALRTLLHKLLNPTRPVKGWAGLFRGRRSDRAAAVAALKVQKTSNLPSVHEPIPIQTMPTAQSESNRQPDESDHVPDKQAPVPVTQESVTAAAPPSVAASGSARSTQAAARSAVTTGSPSPADIKARDLRRHKPRRQQILLLAASLAISIVIFLYVQVTVNPIETRNFSLQLVYENIESAEGKGLQLQVPIQTVQVTLMGRQKTVADLRSEDVTAYLDFSKVEKEGLLSMPIEIKVDRLLHLQTTYISPQAVTVSVRKIDG